MFFLWCGDENSVSDAEISRALNRRLRRVFGPKRDEITGN
jgi:hypothetical protein